ncbi:hypothetical protein JOB18_000437 [Solea senegalensis]|uniref:Uncharacterized protein n=1 Tax=Solea senegalensis TaxID=28829 RepID=A0AAV6PY08_SOLSE|nr:hypothetical protein JOB18_000437 [Solea senegalensis]
MKAQLKEMLLINEERKEQSCTRAHITCPAELVQREEEVGCSEAQPMAECEFLVSCPSLDLRHSPEAWTDTEDWQHLEEEWRTKEREANHQIFMLHKLSTNGPTMEQMKTEPLIRPLPIRPSYYPQFSLAPTSTSAPLFLHRQSPAFTPASETLFKPFTPSYYPQNTV